MQIRISLNRSLRQLMIDHLSQAYRSSQVRVIRRIHTVLFIEKGIPLPEAVE